MDANAEPVSSVARCSGKAGEIWTLPLDGSAEASRLIAIDGEPSHAVPAPDGRSLMVVLATAHGSQLVRVALDGRTPAVPLAAFGGLLSPAVRSLVPLSRRWGRHQRKPGHQQCRDRKSTRLNSSHRT